MYLVWVNRCVLAYCYECVRVSDMKGSVLGLATYQRTGELAGNVLQSLAGEIDLGVHDLQAIFVAMLVVGGLFIYQVIVRLVRLKREKRFSILGFLLIVFLDILLFFLIIVGHLGVHQYLLKYSQPRQVQVERVGESLMSIRYDTYEDKMGMVAWGYDPEQVNMLVVGGAGEKRVKEHEFLIDVEPLKKVYYYLVIDGERYGIGDKPYVLEATKGYKLEEIEVSTGSSRQRSQE